MLNPSDILHASILIVDDQQANVTLLERMLRGAGYVHITSTTDPGEACVLYRRHRHDLVLLDIQMPGMDGFQVMEQLREAEPDGYLPILVITAQLGHKLRALQAGAKDFISKPFELVEVLARVRNLLEVRLLHTKLKQYNEVLEQRVQERTADLKRSYIETIFTMTRAAEYSDEETGAHVQRIGYSSRELASRLGLGVQFVETIFFASPMHDIGKIGIPEHILLKPGSFTPQEWAIMKQHTVIGASILGNSQSPYLQMGAEIALNHHERWDGGGYPNGRHGEAIPLSARVMNICDVYDALRSRRPYKPAFEHAAAMDIMVRGDDRIAPGHFDPILLAVFRQHHAAFRDIFESYADHSPQ